MRPVVRSLAVAAPLAVLLLAGCGENPGARADDRAGDWADARADDRASETQSQSPGPGAESTSPPASPSTKQSPQARLPRCSDVWVDGKAFPLYYEGCRAGGEVVRAKPLICESMQRLYVHGDHFWAVGGARVVATDGPYRDDPQYTRAHRACTA